MWIYKKNLYDDDLTAGWSIQTHRKDMYCIGMIWEHYSKLFDTTGENINSISFVQYL